MHSRKDYWNDALQHLKKSDAVFAKILSSKIEIEEQEQRTSFQALTRSIVGQQISTSAAASVWKRVGEVCGGEVTPECVAALDATTLRSAGLSAQKTTYCKALAQWFIDAHISDSYFATHTFDEIHTALIAVPGIGHWTIHMFALFHLEMPDIWPTGDLGIQRALEMHYPEVEKKSKRLKGKKKEKMFMKAGIPFAPYRSVAALYLWRSLDTAPIAQKKKIVERTQKIKK